MAPQFKGACGHCGGTGFDIDSTPDYMDYGIEDNNGIALAHVTNWPNDTINQYPVVPDFGPLLTDSYPFIPDFDAQAPSLPPTNTMNWTGEGMYNAAQGLNGLSTGPYYDTDNSMLSNTQLFTPPLPSLHDFDLTDDYSTLYSPIPELDTLSDMDTTSSLTPQMTPEELRSPLELINSPATASPSDKDTRRFKCDFCPASFPSKPKLNVHVKKHTKPHKCTVPGCGYEAAEKKSLHRHVAASAKWDRDHELAAQRMGVRTADYHCLFDGCTYASIRDDNRNRHEQTCPHGSSVKAEKGVTVR